MDTSKVYDDFYKLLENNDTVPTDDNLFILLQQYITARMIDLVGTRGPIHFFYQEHIPPKKPNELYTLIRQNPLTNEICKKKWPFNVRAICAETGVFIDFEANNNRYEREISGDEKIIRLIDFAHNVDHEIQHIVQKRALKKKGSTYDNLLASQEFTTLQSLNGEYPPFYLRAHDNMFIEKDANYQAEKHLRKELSKRNLLSRVVSTYGGSIRDIESILDSLIAEGHTSRSIVSHNHDMYFGISKSLRRIKVTAPAEEIIILITDSAVRLNPNYYLSNFPALKEKYNLDGTKKTYHEIQKELEQNPTNYIFYHQFIKDDPLLRIEQIESQMINNYLDTNNKQRKTEILTQGLTAIQTIINTHDIDLENTLVYLNKRINEITSSTNDSISESTAKLIFSLTKQVILEKPIIRNAYKITELTKEEIVLLKTKLQKEYNINCDIEDEELGKKLLELAEELANKNDRETANSIYNYHRYIRQNSYIIEDNNDNLYQTAYYQEIIENNSNIIEKLELKDEFKLINELYILIQELAINKDIEALEDNPLITYIIKENPNIINILYQMKDMEKNLEYLPKISYVIGICESYLQDSKEKTR